MSDYNKILVAVDPSLDNRAIVQKAKQMLGKNGRLELVAVVDVGIIFSGSPYAPTLVNLKEINDQTQKWVNEQLHAMADDNGLDRSNVHVLLGSVASEIKKYAETEGVDLIVMGSHGRHGIGLILGSTATGVLHGMPCDVLVIKITD